MMSPTISARSSTISAPSLWTQTKSKSLLLAIREEVVAITAEQYIPPGSLEEMWDADGLSKALESEFGVRADVRALGA